MKKLILIGKMLIVGSLLWPVPFGFLWILLRDSLIYAPLAKATEQTFSGEPSFIAQMAEEHPDIMSYIGAIPMWGESRGYWWPLLGIMAVGFILCIIGARKLPKVESLSWKKSPITYLGHAILFSIIGILAFMAVVMLVVGVYWFFRYVDSTIQLVVFISLLVLGWTIFIGLSWYKHHKSDNQNNP